MDPDVSLLSRAGGRNKNEDYCRFDEKDSFGCYLLADGLGGHKGGDVASRVIGEAVSEAFLASPGLSLEKLSAYIAHAREVFTGVTGSRNLPAGMKSTLVVLLLSSTQALWGHIGDSRLYYFSLEKISFQTRDHSVPQMLADSGDISKEQIRFHEDRNRLTAAFDGSDMPRFEYLKEPVMINKGDAFLLCSDGFWEYLTEGEMEEDLKNTIQAEEWLKLMERRLLKRVKSGHDNYSALTVRIR
jgi:PPM family protein phosphatase